MSTVQVQHKSGGSKLSDFYFTPIYKIIHIDASISNITAKKTFAIAEEKQLVPAWKLLVLSTAWVKKQETTLAHNFAKYWPIFKILSSADSAVIA